MREPPKFVNSELPKNSAKNFVRLWDLDARCVWSQRYRTPSQNLYLLWLVTDTSLRLVCLTHNQSVSAFFVFYDEEPNIIRFSDCQDFDKKTRYNFNFRLFRYLELVKGFGK